MSSQISSTPKRSKDSCKFRRTQYPVIHLLERMNFLQSSILDEKHHHINMCIMNVEFKNDQRPLPNKEINRCPFSPFCARQCGLRPMHHSLLKLTSPKLPYSFSLLCLTVHACSNMVSVCSCFMARSIKLILVKQYNTIVAVLVMLLLLNTATLPS